MKLVVFLTALSTVCSFMPAAPAKQSTAVSMDRRQALASFGGMAVATTAFVPNAFADGSVSKATIQRAAGIYGSRIADLATAANNGDFGAFVAEKNAFILFNSGAIKDKAKQSEAIAATNDIFAAIRAQDAKALKAAYAAYVQKFEITGLPEADPSTQGFGNDFDFKARTKAGTLYVR